MLPWEQEVKQTSQRRDRGLTVNATYKAHADYTEIAGAVADSRGEGRAVTVHLALPVAERPGKPWWSSSVDGSIDATNSPG